MRLVRYLLPHPTDLRVLAGKAASQKRALARSGWRTIAALWLAAALLLPVVLKQLQKLCACQGPCRWRLKKPPSLSVWKFEYHGDSRQLQLLQVPPGSMSSLWLGFFASFPSLHGTFLHIPNYMTLRNCPTSMDTEVAPSSALPLGYLELPFAATCLWTLPMTSTPALELDLNSLGSCGCWASLVAQTVKNLPAVQETWVPSVGWEDPLEQGMATHSSILAWRIPMDRGAWWAMVHGVAKSQTWLSNQVQHSRSCLNSFFQIPQETVCPLRENTKWFKMGNSLETHTKYHGRAEMGYRDEHLKVLSPKYLIITVEQTMV